MSNFILHCKYLVCFFGKTMTSSRVKRKLTFTADGFGISLFVEKAIKRGKTSKETTTKKLFVAGCFHFTYLFPLTIFFVLYFETLQSFNVYRVIVHQGSSCGPRKRAHQQDIARVLGLVKIRIGESGCVVRLSAGLASAECMCVCLDLCLGQHFSLYSRLRSLPLYWFFVNPNTIPIPFKCALFHGPQLLGIEQMSLSEYHLCSCKSTSDSKQFFSKHQIPQLIDNCTFFKFKLSKKYFQVDGACVFNRIRKLSPMADTQFPVFSLSELGRMTPNRQPKGVNFSKSYPFEMAAMPFSCNGNVFQ